MIESKSKAPGSFLFPLQLKVNIKVHGQKTRMEKLYFYIEHLIKETNKQKKVKLLYCGAKKKMEAGGRNDCIQKSPQEIPWGRNYKGDSSIP